MAGNIRKPQLIVFDLDYTLWPFWVDTHFSPPFKKEKNGKVVDAHKDVIEHYPDSPEVLKWLVDEGYTLAVASRTSATEDAVALLHLFGWTHYFTYKEIYPGCKLTHFNRFKTLSGLKYEDMIFFDDEHRNISDTKRVGVFAIHVENGITTKLVKDALRKFSST